MTAPLIVASLAASARAREQAHYDPVEAGFNEFRYMPRESRKELVREMSRVVLRPHTRGTNSLNAHIESYTDKVALAAISTAASTGLTQLSLPLIYRASSAHFYKEKQARQDLERNQLLQSVTGSWRKRIWAENRFSHEALYSSAIETAEGPKMIDELLRGASLPEIEQFVGQELLQSMTEGKISKADVAAFQVARDGLAVPIRKSVDSELGGMRIAYGAATQRFPDLAQ